MLDGLSILIPGGLRLRSVRPLADREGAFPLLYDLERSKLVDVPSDFRFHVAAALETGDLDEDLLAWLASEDVLTWERQSGWPAGDWGLWSELGSARLGPPSTGTAGEVYFFRNRVHSRIDLDSPDGALSTLTTLLSKADGASLLTLELAGRRPTRDFELLQQMVDEAGRWGRLTAREIAFDLAVDAAALTPRFARFLAEHPFNVHVYRDGIGTEGDGRSWRRGLRLLLAELADRLTVHATVGAGERLADLWAWAKRAGVRHLDATKVDDLPAFDPSRHEAELRQFRSDLFEVCDETFADLELTRVPLLYEPVARIVRRLLSGRPVTPAEGGEGSYLGLMNNGEVLPFCGHPSPGAASAGAGSAADWETGGGDLCEVCWGRCLCGRSYAERTGSPQPVPADGRCDFWRAEIEVAILFFDRLRKADATYLLGFPADGPEVVFDALPAPQMIELKTC